MALCGEVELWDGVKLYSSYCKIMKILFIPRRNQTVIYLGVYKKCPENTEQEPIIIFAHTCEKENAKFFSDFVLKQEGKEPISQAYKWLKTLEQYSKMIDDN